MFAEERWLFVKEEEREAALTEEILATAAAAREQLKSSPASTPVTVPGHAPSTLFKFVFLAFHAFSMFFSIQVVDVESDDDEESPAAAESSGPDAEMSDGAAPSVVDPKTDQEMPGPVAPPVLDPREQELLELKRKYEALLQSMQQLQLQKLGPNSPEQVKICFSPAAQDTTPGGSSVAGTTPAGSISSKSTETPPPTDTRT